MTRVQLRPAVLAFAGLLALAAGGCATATPISVNHDRTQPRPVPVSTGGTESTTAVASTGRTSPPSAASASGATGRSASTGTVRPGGMGNASGSGGPTTGATTPTTAVRAVPPATVSTTVPRSSSVLVQLTRADNGTTVSIPVGGSVEVTLQDAGTRWGAPSVSPSGMLQFYPAPAVPVGGQQVILTATRPGTATITATGTFACPDIPHTGCALAVQLFRVTISIT